MNNEPFTPEQLQALTGSNDEQAAAKSLYDSGDMSKLIETYMAVDIPKDAKEHILFREFWAVLDRTIKLTFFTPEDVEDCELLFEVAKVDFLQSKPAYKYSFDDIKHLDQLKIYFIAAIKRSVGTGQHRFNDRIILGGTINQTIRSNTDTIQSGSQGGFLSKLRSKV